MTQTSSDPSPPPIEPRAPLPRSPTADMPFLDHLEELRWRIIKSLAAVAVTVAGSFAVLAQFDVIGFLARPILPLLNGVRGAGRADLGAVTQLMESLSLLVESAGDTINEIDLNPVFVYDEGKGTVVVDAVIVGKAMRDKDV